HARARRPLSRCRAAARILAAFAACAFAFSLRTDMRPAFARLLAGAARRFLALGPGAAAAVLAFAFVLGRAGLVQRDGDGLLAASHLAAFAAASALQLAMLELVHHAAFDTLLPGCRFCHGSLLLQGKRP